MSRPSDLKLAARIREALDFYGFSLQLAADALGKSKSTIHRWTTTGTLHADELESIAALLGISVAYLFRPVGARLPGRVGAPYRRRKPITRRPHHHAATPKPAARGPTTLRLDLSAIIPAGAGLSRMMNYQQGSFPYSRLIRTEQTCPSCRLWIPTIPPKGD